MGYLSSCPSQTGLPTWPWYDAWLFWGLSNRGRRETNRHRSDDQLNTILISVVNPCCAEFMLDNIFVFSIISQHLTHWGRVTHICVGNLTIIGSDNGLSPGRHQAITWTNIGILLIGPLGTNFSEMLIEIHTFSFKEFHLKMLSGKWQPFCLGLNVLNGAVFFPHGIQGLIYPI